MGEVVELGLTPLHHEVASLRIKIIEALRQAIEQGVLQPGARLVEKNLCEQLDVSRTSLREALRELQAEGVLTHVSNKGLTVTRITRRDAENIYRIRADLEALVVEQCAQNASDDDIENLEQYAAELKTEYLAGDFIRIVGSKRRFYNLICEVADNSIAINLLNRLTLLTSQLRRVSIVRPDRQAESVGEITDLMVALKRRDIASARKYAKLHVENAALSALSSAEF
ncbi:MAG: GntR family transcriptional regulator [Rhodospirillaceae bacterium]|jgi:DNA-binding GntR family transcriptional regulator|nr:GntR family transcriptional regulator [Rhodospirillales bacterium]MBT3904044.1 GntR family transcriptional regulator [Rhodospirillaceae bacterium]MBT4702935.1 GntR family transcriptional regulator [Rhodospirillaceae bacterium]MBT5036495.1 GntR family transcriptional regulator [Rhodospirillaceae bacterium]MBT6219626.1 GntR family transcriptional regulator [Rhodospirillaceae bacterium]